MSERSFSGHAGLPARLLPLLQATHDAAKAPLESLLSCESAPPCCTHPLCAWQHVHLRMAYPAVVPAPLRPLAVLSATQVDHQAPPSHWRCSVYVWRLFSSCLLLRPCDVIVQGVALSFQQRLPAPNPARSPRIASVSRLPPVTHPLRQQRSPGQRLSSVSCPRAEAWAEAACASSGSWLL